LGNDKVKMVKWETIGFWSYDPPFPSLTINECF
jgi:hypothetical protein